MHGNAEVRRVEALYEVKIRDVPILGYASGCRF